MPDQTPPSHDWLTADETAGPLTPEDLAELQRTHPGMPCYVVNDDEFRAAVEVGLADIRAGRTVSFAEVAARLRKTYNRS